MTMTRVSVLVDDDRLTDLAAIVAALRSAGLEVAQVLEELGTVTGVVDDSRLGGLRRVAGVAAVEPSRDYQLPPPEAPVQ